jgi:hypothetical protein
MSSRERLAVIALIGALTATWLPRLRGPIDLRWDAAVYYTLGTSLAEGRGYRLLNEPGEIKATTWPPALPAFIALHERALGTSDPVVVGTALRRSFLVIWIAYLAAAYWLFRRYLGFALSAVATAMCGLHLSAVWLSDRAYTDIPLAFVITLFFATRKEGSHLDLKGWVLASLAFLLRTVGGALLLAWMAEPWFRRSFRTAIVRTALAVVPIAAWQGYIAHVEHEAEYKSPPYEYARADYALYNVSYARNMTLRNPDKPELGKTTAAELAERVLGNALTIPSHVGGAISVSESDWAAVMADIKTRPIIRHLVPWRGLPIALIVLAAICAIGFVDLIRRNTTMALSVVLYFAFLCLLPTSYHWLRYLVAISPLLVLALMLGLQRLRAPLAGEWQRLGGMAGATLMSGIVLLQAATLVWYFRHEFEPVVHEQWHGHRVAYSLFSYDPSFESFDNGLEWLQTHAGRSSIAVSSMASWVYLRTGLHSVMPPFVSRHDEELRLLDSVPADFVVVDTCGLSSTREYARPALRTATDWTLAFAASGESLEIYQRAPLQSVARR